MWHWHLPLVLSAIGRRYGLWLPPRVWVGALIGLPESGGPEEVAAGKFVPGPASSYRGPAQVEAQEMNGMWGGTTQPRMTTAPTLILGTMARAVTTAELSTLLMFRRIPFPSA